MKKLNILALLFLAISLHAQIISGMIKSNDDQSAVPYAKIGIENENIGVIADERGSFYFDLTDISRDKTVKIEVGGFEVFKTSVAELIKQNPQNILLNAKVRNIDEVKIRKKKLVAKNWGVKTKTKNVIYAVNPEVRGKGALHETAIEFNTKKKAKIEKVKLNIPSFMSDKPVILRYTFYNEKDGMPGEEISTEDILVSLTADKIVDGTFSLDISDKNIWVKDTFYVGIQFLTDFTGRINISAALFRAGFIRTIFGEWEKMSIAAPAINIDVKVDKKYKNEIEDNWKDADETQEKRNIESLRNLKNIYNNRNN